jgi:hypothetical protein
MLTYMATLEDLVAMGHLLPHRADLDNGELPDRAVYFDPAFDSGFGAKLPLLSRLHGRKLTPHEQAEQLLYDFVIGRPMAYSVDYRKLDPLSAHAWELKTPDVRLFGWFPRRANLVIVSGELKDNLPTFKAYSPFIQEVIAFRGGLDLDEPKSVTGVTHDEIL